MPYSYFLMCHGVEKVEKLCLRLWVLQQKVMQSESLELGTADTASTAATTASLVPGTDSHSNTGVLKDTVGVSNWGWSVCVEGCLPWS